MLRVFRSSLVPSSVLCLILVSGCDSGKGVTVSGKLILPRNMKLAETDSVSVTFIPEDNAKAGGAVATVNPSTLTFDTAVKPGKYKVAVTVQPYAGTPDSDKRGRAFSDALGMYSAGGSALSYEVTSDSKQSIVIDVSSQGGSVRKE